jgi:dTDP-4-dehydrorhamnose 3,5-epimerase
MKVTELALPGTLLIEPMVFTDERGRFLELWQRDRYSRLGVPEGFEQDNISCSHRGVLRGLHFQDPHPQGKLVSVLHGEVFDVAVDVRPASPTYGQWLGTTLSAENGRQLWLPPGLAHGFVVTSEQGALFAYKCTAPYVPAAEWTLRWNDPALDIRWPVAEPVVSAKDQAGLTLEALEAARGQSALDRAR